MINKLTNKIRKEGILLIGILLVTSLISAGMFIRDEGLFDIYNINNFRLGEEMSEDDLASEMVDDEQTNELVEQTIPIPYDSRINDINKNNIIENEN